MQMRYEQEKKDTEELRALQKKREELRVKLKEAEARYDLAMVADLKCAPSPHAETGAPAAGAGAGCAAVPQACHNPASHKKCNRARSVR
jgi:hypothetical protein